MREGLHNEVIFAVFLFFVSIFLLLLLTGCELRENAVIREQTDIFTDEIREKNRDMQSLANQLKVANEKNKKLEQMLLCRDELTDDAVDQAKRDMLKTVPVLLPKKSNKAEAERNQ
jgi:gas vesicle protein